MVEPRPPTNNEKPLIKRGRVDSVNLYEIKEEELELLEKGSPASVQLGFAIFLFSSAVTCIAAWATADFKWDIVENIFAFIGIGGIISGVYLLVIWWRTRKSISRVVLTIRKRIDPDPIRTSDPVELEPKEPKNDYDKP